MWNVSNDKSLFFWNIFKLKQNNSKIFLIIKFNKWWGYNTNDYRTSVQSSECHWDVFLVSRLLADLHSDLI